MFDDGEYKNDGLENESGRHGNPFRRGEIPAPKSIFRLQTKSSPAGGTVDVLTENRLVRFKLLQAFWTIDLNGIHGVLRILSCSFVGSRGCLRNCPLFVRRKIVYSHDFLIRFSGFPNHFVGLSSFLHFIGMTNRQHANDAAQEHHGQDDAKNHRCRHSQSLFWSLCFPDCGELRNIEVSFAPRTSYIGSQEGNLRFKRFAAMRTNDFDHAHVLLPITDRSMRRTGCSPPVPMIRFVHRQSCIDPSIPVWAGGLGCCMLSFLFRD